MKKIKLVLLMLFAFMAAAFADIKDSDPSLDFRFANEQIVQEGDTYFFLFDVEVRATEAGTYHRDMQVYFDYNPAVFGNSIKANGKITVEKIGIMAEEFSGNFKYIWVNESIPQGYGTDNTPSRYYITSETSFPTFGANAMFHTEITTEWAGYMRAKIEISDFGYPAGIQMIGMLGGVTFMDGGQYYQSADAQPVVYTFPYGYMNDLMDYMISLDEDPYIVSITPVDPVIVPFGTILDDAVMALPATTTITDSEAGVHVVDLTWTIPGYNGDLAGDYEAIATFELPVGVVQSEPETTLEVTTTVTVLEAPVYTLTLIAVPEEGGEVFGAGEYEEGEIASVNAIANEGWVFVNWTDPEDNLVSDVAANDIVITEDLTLFANFEQIPPEVFTLTLLVNPEGAGEVFGAGEYEEGEVASVNAVANEGWVFVNWTDTEDNIVSEMPANDIPMTADLTLIANFEEEIVEPDTYLLTLLVNPLEAGEVIGSGEYEEETQIVLFALGNEGWIFLNWTNEDDEVISNSPEFVFVMPAMDVTLTANFEEQIVEPETYILTLLVNPEGAGEVFGAGEYEEGEVASVNAVANEGWEFVNWTDTEDNIISEMPANEIPITADLTLIANFVEEIVEPETYILTLLVNPDGAGIVTGEGEYEAGEEVTITATANEGWEFVNWTVVTFDKDNGAFSDQPVFTFNMPENNLTLQANFVEEVIEPETYILTLLVNPEGAGEVFGAGEYEEGEVASVNAVANEGWVFVNWTDLEDNVVSELPANDIPMTADLTLIANFEPEIIEPEIYTLTLLVNPEGAGEVFGAGDYEEGTFASVNAVANEGWVFVNWTDLEDNIVSTMPANDIPMTADLTLIANFTEVVEGELIVTIDITGVTCPGDDDGSVYITVTGGQKPYDICLAYGCGNEDVFNKTSTAHYGGLLAGYYQLTIVDADGVSYEECIWVPEPDPIMVEVDLDVPLCFEEEMTATATYTISGGTPPYTFDGEPVEGNTVVMVYDEEGTFSHMINDDNDCGPVETEVTVVFPVAIEAAVEYDPILCFGETTLVDVIAEGGTGTLSLYDVVEGELVFVSELPLAEPLELGAGTYTWVVMDENECEFPLDFEITQPDLLEAEVVYEPIECYGETTLVDVNAMGGTGTLSLYDVVDDELVFVSELPLEDPLALGAGMYTWVVMDENECQVPLEFTLTEPDLLEAYLISSTEPTCFGYDDGSAIIEITGGTPPYLPDFGELDGNMLTLTNLSAGNYVVTITDAKNCGPAMVEFDLGEPDPITVQLDEVVDVLCYGDASGAILVSVAGGNGGFMYSLDGEVFQDNGLFEDLLAGVYTVYVVDENGCEGMLEGIIVEQPDELLVDLEVTDVSCFGEGDGEIMGYITGGVGPYNVCLFTECDEDLENGDFDPLKGQGFLHWDLIPGEYMIVVTDQNGCQWMECVTIYEPEPFSVTYTDLEDVTCNGDDTGEISIVFEGGTMPYNLSWEGQETFDIEGSSYTITGLTAGDYAIYADDANGCGPVVIEFSCLEPAMPLMLEESEVGNVSCNGGSDGYIQLFPSGGVGEYTVSGDLEALFTQGLMAGIYEFTVTDENGCFVTGSEIITEPEPLTVTIEIEDLVCEGDGEEAYASDWIWYRQGLTNAGNLPNADRSDPEKVTGEPEYGDEVGSFFSLGFGGEMIAKFEAPVANGPGNDLFIVETTYGSQTCDTYPEKVDVWVAQYIDETLYTPVQGEVDVLGLGDEWIYIGQGCLNSEFDFGEMPWVQYVYMKDVSDPDDFSNSQISDGFDIDGLVALNGSLVVSANLMAIAEGGTPEYMFLWNTDETDAMISVAAQGMYTVYVTDANGCMTEATVEVYCGEYMDENDDDKLFADEPFSGYLDILNSKVFPNPFRSEATIEFTLARNTTATIYLYNLAGERVALLFEGSVNAFETQQVRFGSENLNSGVYFYHLNTGSEVYINKVVLVK